MSAESFPLQWPQGWPRTNPYKRRSRFAFKNNTASRAHSRVLEELRMLSAQNVVVSSNAQILRREGTMGSAGNDMLDDPGVALYFMLGGRQMVMAQDLYETPAANLRSLGIAIEAMRAIERHGGGHMMQQAFEGFAQLPPPDGSTAPTMRPWRDVLDMPVSVYGALPSTAQLAVAESGYRERAREAHPDKPGGSAEAMAELNVAIDAARQELT